MYQHPKSLEQPYFSVLSFYFYHILKKYNRSNIENRLRISLLYQKYLEVWILVKLSNLYL